MPVKISPACRLLCSDFSFMCSSWMGWLPNSGSGLTSEFPRVIKALLFDSHLLGSQKKWQRRSDLAIRGVKTTCLCKVSVTVIFLSTISRCWSEHNICFHSRIFGGIRTSGPGSWTFHVGGTRPLISFSRCTPLIWWYRIYAWPGLGERTARKRQGGERMRHWRVLMVVQ